MVWKQRRQGFVQGEDHGLEAEKTRVCTGRRPWFGSREDKGLYREKTMIWKQRRQGFVQGEDHGLDAETGGGVDRCVGVTHLLQHAVCVRRLLREQQLRVVQARLRFPTVHANAEHLRATFLRLRVNGALLRRVTAERNGRRRTIGSENHGR